MELKATSFGKHLAQHPYNRVRLLTAGVEVKGDRHEYLIPFNQLIAINCKRGLVWGELEFVLPDDKVVRLHGTEWNETQRFYHHILGQHGEAPHFCEAWINRAVVLQHLYCPAMWSIFQLQDILGMSENLRRDNPNEERINQPADPKHYWRYRMHLTLEELLKQKDFNEELRGYVVHSGR